MAFATPTELRALMQTTEELLPDPTAQIAVDAATGDIRAYLDQQITPVVANDEIVITPAHEGVDELLLPELPASAVGAVSIGDDDELDAEDYYLTSYGTIRLRSGGTWGCGPVHVTYTHGYAENAVPLEIKSVCLTLAARKLGNPAGVKSEGIGTYSVTNADAPLDDEEKSKLDGFRASTGLG